MVRKDGVMWVAAFLAALWAVVTVTLLNSNGFDIPLKKKKR